MGNTRLPNSLTFLMLVEKELIRMDPIPSTMRLRWQKSLAHGVSNTIMDKHHVCIPTTSPFMQLCTARMVLAIHQKLARKILKMGFQ